MESSTQGSQHQCKATAARTNEVPDRTGCCAQRDAREPADPHEMERRDGDAPQRLALQSGTERALLQGDEEEVQASRGDQVQMNRKNRLNAVNQIVVLNLI